MPVYTTRDNKEKILSPEFVNALKRAKIEKLAIVSFAGVTGAGKSTVINYLISLREFEHSEFSKRRCDENIEVSYDSDFRLE
jgi:putative ribosome biogenesis GTPase RsgA